MIRQSALGVLLVVALLVPQPQHSVIAAGATLTVNPAKLKAGQKAAIQATHLKAGKFYSVLLAVPNLRKPLVERFLGAGKADSHGTLKINPKVPVITNCGKASLNVFPLPAHSSSPTASIAVTLSGCKGKPLSVPKGPAPPPPPKKP